MLVFWGVAHPCLENNPFFQDGLFLGLSLLIWVRLSFTNIAIMKNQGYELPW